MESFGGPEVLVLDDVAAPAPRPEEVRVRVAAVEVARTRDIATRGGEHAFSRRITLPHVLGGDCVGVIDALGDGVSDIPLGTHVAVATHVTCGACTRCLAGHDEVCERLRLLGIDMPGSYAELVVTERRSVTPLPDGLSVAQAGALAADGPVALEQLEVSGVGPGQRVLIVGVGGALGSTVACLAAACGAQVWGLSRRSRVELAALPLEDVVSTLSERLDEELLERTAGTGFDVIVDNVALAPVVARYWPALAVGGRIVISGSLDPAPIPVPARVLYTHNQSVIGVRSASRATAAKLWDLVEAGFRLPADSIKTLPLAQAQTAHRAVADSADLGHLLLTPGDGDWPPAPTALPPA
jgi:D-arabinose 1-dehydrogenase-like Zn-dependent alcohol dehydrogenase